MTNETTTKTEGNRKPLNGTPWPPGVSGNPNGRPKTSMTSILKDCLEKTDGKTGKTTKQLIIDRLLALADHPRGLPAIQEILDRVDGKVTDKLQVNGMMIVSTPAQLVEMRIKLNEIMANEQKLLDEGT